MGASSRGEQCGVGTFLSSEPWFGDWLTSKLLLHLPPLLAGQHKVHMLSRDILTEGVLVDTEINRNLEVKHSQKLDLHFFRISQAHNT